MQDSIYYYNLFLTLVNKNLLDFTFIIIKSVSTFRQTGWTKTTGRIWRQIRVCGRHRTDQIEYACIDGTWLQIKQFAYIVIIIHLNQI